MKFPPVLILTGLAAVARLAAAAPETMLRPAPEAPAKDPAALLRELSDESYQVREKATKELWALGEAALPLLNEAAASSDPEQAVRARQVLRMVRFHIMPDTDPSVIELVERYQKASLTEKAGLLGKMKGKRAWRQMLKLYASETSAEARKQLKSAVDGVSIRAARELLAQGDAKGAREFLEMAPADAEGLMALAAFHRSQGTLDAELERAENLKPANPAWLLALHRAAGNIPAAREAALAAGETGIAASMSVLMGDPLPMMLRILREQAEQQNPLSEAYATIATRRWLGEKVRSADSEPLARALAAPDSSERYAAMSAMFLLGDVEAAEQTFMKTNPLAAFRHFESLERIADAHKAFKLDVEKPDYKTWVRKRTEKITGLEIEDQQGVSTHSEELVALANFLERRGLHDTAFEAYAEPVAALAEKDDEPFLGFLGELFGNSGTLSGAPRLACRIGSAWAGKDEKRWQDLAAAAFGEDESSAWWDWLAELDPKADLSRRFEAMLALHDIGTDPKKLRGKYLALAWKAVDAAPAAEKENLAGRISMLSNHAQDVENSLRAWELISENAREEVFWGERIIHLSAAERWKEAADVVLEHIRKINESPEEPADELHARAYAAACLRLAGNEQEARLQDQLLDGMVLGNASIAMQVGNGYAFGRDAGRAREWWARAAIEADPDSNEYTLALKFHSDALLEQGRWKETAATSEIVAQSYASIGRNTSTPLLYMRQRLQADMARALSILKDDRPAALAILAKCHRTFASDGSLADFFFPALRKVGLIKEHDEWFNDSWRRMQEIVRLHPESDNTRNTAAWFATRALRRLDEAEAHLRKALELNPEQPAYLDTMAELQFARGKRDKAIEWSRRAINFAPEDMQLRQQHFRFLSEPLPK